MALLDVIECTDQQPGELCRRIPKDGSAETRFGSQLVVRDYQTAIFRKDGKGLDVFEAGRHTLSSKNLPILSKILGIPFGFKSSFRTEVVFVSRRTIPALKWGTREPVPFRDGELASCACGRSARTACGSPSPSSSRTPSSARRAVRPEQRRGI